jgi:hypothetical protein
MFAVFATFAEAVDLRGASWIDNWLAQPQLMGNWFGARAALAGWGITPIARYGPDMQANVLGGQRRGKAYAGDFAIDVTVDLEKLSGARGLTFGVSGDWTKSGIRFRWNLLPDVLACLRKQVKVLGDAEKNEPSLFGPGAFAEPEPESAATAEGPCADRLVDVLGENLKAFPTDFLAGVGGKGTRIRLPGESLRLEQENTGAWILKTQDGVFAKVRNPAEGNFILYAQMRGLDEIIVPGAMIEVFKVVKGYENYVRGLRARVFAKLQKKARQESVATYETRKVFQRCGLPELDA